MVLVFRRIFIVFITLALFPLVFLHAAGMFEDFPVSVRVSAMGGASAALVAARLWRDGGGFGVGCGDDGEIPGRSPGVVPG